MTRPPRRAEPLAVFVFCLGLLAPAAARGQSMDQQTALAAQSLYEQATAEMDAKSYPSACRKLEEVTRIVPDALGAKLALAECYVGLGKLASAWSQYALVEKLAMKVGEAPRAQSAGESAAALKPKLATLVVEVPSEVRSIEGLVIARDGAPLGEALWGTALPADAGGHEVVATAPGRKPWKGRVEIVADGANVSIAVGPLEVDPNARRTADLAASAGSTGPVRPWQRPLGIAAMGIGGAGVAIGAVLGGLALAKNGESNKDNHCDAQDRCDDAGLELRNQAVGLGNGSTAVIVVGAVVLAGGVVLFATAPAAGVKEERAGSGAGAGAGRWSAKVELLPGGMRVKGSW